MRIKLRLTWLLFILMLPVAHAKETQNTRIELTVLGLYEPGALVVYRLGSNYLLSATLPDDMLLVVDKQGTLLYRYTLSGQGPEALQAHSILAITSSRIFVHSMSNGVLVFNHKLELLTETQDLAPLAQNISAIHPTGIATQDDQFVVYNHLFSRHHLFYFDLADAQPKQGAFWLPAKKVLEKMYPIKGIRDPEISAFHQGHLFTYRPMITEERTSYTIWVHLVQRDKWQIIAELTHEAEELAPWVGNLKGVVNQVFKIDQGYLVEISGSRPNATSPRDLAKHYDRYDQNGIFQKRVTRYDHILFKVEGSHELLLLQAEEDTDILVPFQLNF